MRRICRGSVLAHTAPFKPPFHAGCAVFQVLQARAFTASPPSRRRSTPGIRWYEQSRAGVRPQPRREDANGDDIASLTGAGTDEAYLEELGKELEAFRRDGPLKLDEDGPDGGQITDEDAALLKQYSELLQQDIQGREELAAAEDGAARLASTAQEDRLLTTEEQELQTTESQLQNQLEGLSADLLRFQGSAGAGKLRERSGRRGRRRHAGVLKSQIDQIDGGGDQNQQPEVGESLKSLEGVSDLGKETLDSISKEAHDLRQGLLEYEGLDVSDKQWQGQNVSKKNKSKSVGTVSTDLDTLEMEFKLPTVIKNQIGAFNEAIKMASAHPNHIYHRRSLWVNYMRCQREVPAFLKQVTNPAWQVLWQSQSSEPFYDEQADHLLVLAENMRSVRKPLSGAQKLLCIKAYEADGRIEEALDLWKKEQKSLVRDKYLRFEYSALGVTLECRAKRPDKAEAIALQAISRDGNNSGAARLVFPVISSWAKEGSETGIKRAWQLYIFARQMLLRQTSQEHRMTAEDHDEIFLGFLDAGRRDLALMVFKDLILVGTDSRYDSAQIFKSMGVGLERIHASLQDPKELNKISLDALVVLPKRFENKYFYASWMKRLIGMGRIADAASIVELMYERGVEPDPKHLNGILGYWLRQGSDKEQIQALDLAWSMVEKRLDVVTKRRSRNSNASETANQALSQQAVPAHLHREVPAASVETFCLLLLYYVHRNALPAIENIKKLVSAAELQPNSYFMNHLMVSYIKQGNPAGTWRLFTDMSRRTPPDITTFDVLWGVSDNLTKIYEQLDKFPGPRRLFSAMTDWFAQLGPREKSAAVQDVDPRIYGRIIASFSHWKDLNASLVAMYALRDMFGLYPDEQTMRLVSLQVASMSEKRQAPHVLGRSRVRRRKATDQSSTKNIDIASRALGMLLDNRKADLAEQGILLERLSEREQGEERLALLAEFLRAAQREFVKATDVSDTQELSEEFDKVAFEMGAGPFRTAAPVYDTETRAIQGAAAA